MCLYLIIKNEKYTLSQNILLLKLKFWLLLLLDGYLLLFDKSSIEAILAMPWKLSLELLLMIWED